MFTRPEFCTGLMTMNDGIAVMLQVAPPFWERGGSATGKLMSTKPAAIVHDPVTLLASRRLSYSSEAPIVADCPIWHCSNVINGRKR